MASLPPRNSTASFWHREPSSYLLGHRTTETLPEEADVVIIGSGISGTCAGRYLAEDERSSHMKVVMLDAREACWGATGRNGGHCQPLILEGTPDVGAFEMRCWKAVRDYIDDNEVPCEWRVNDACHAVWSKGLAEQMTANLEELRRIAPDVAGGAKIITDPEVLTEKYKIKTAVQSLVVSPVAALWPYKLITFILERLIRAEKLNLQTNTPVTSLSRSDDPSHTSQIVSTPRGDIRARHVILATNAYTSHLLPGFSDLIVPERATMSALVPPKNSTRLTHSYGFKGMDGTSEIHFDYLNQRPGQQGHLMYGGGQGAATEDFLDTVDDSVLDEGIATYLRRQLLHLLNLDGEVEDLDELQASHVWTGIWGTSRDSAPWVGAVPGAEKRGLWLVGGYSGHGMPNAPLCAKAIVEMVLGTESGGPLEYIEDRLVRTGQLPQSYLISEERMERCRAMEAVQMRHKKAWMAAGLQRWPRAEGKTLH